VRTRVRKIAFSSIGRLFGSNTIGWVYTMEKCIGPNVDQQEAQLPHSKHANVPCDTRTIDGPP